MEYELNLPYSKPFLNVTVGMKENSTKLGILLQGETVTVVEIKGDRAKISAPVKGWCSYKNTTKGYQYLFARHKKDATEKMLHASRQDSFWQCSICTFNNPLNILVCSKCKTTMPSKLRGVLLMKNSWQDKSLDRLTKDHLKDEFFRSPTRTLRHSVENLCENYIGVNLRVNELEEVNWELEDHDVKMENALKSCVGLSTTDPKNWDISMVCTWLHINGLDVYESDFTEAGVDGKTLLACNDELFQKLNIRPQHRSIILNSVLELQKKSMGFDNELRLDNPQKSPLLSTGESEELLEAVNSPVNFVLNESMVLVSSDDFSSNGEENFRVLKSYAPVADNYEGLHLESARFTDDDDWELLDEI